MKEGDLNPEKQSRSVVSGRDPRLWDGQAEIGIVCVATIFNVLALRNPRGVRHMACKVGCWPVLGPSRRQQGVAVFLCVRFKLGSTFNMYSTCSTVKSFGFGWVHGACTVFDFGENR